MYSVKIKVNKNVVRLVSLILLTILIIPIFRTVIPFVLLLYSIDLFLIFTKKDNAEFSVHYIFRIFKQFRDTVDCLCKGTVGIWLCFCEGVQEYMRI